MPRYVIHEGATLFRDPGVTVHDENDGEMKFVGDCPMELIATDPTQPTKKKCTPIRKPLQVCRVVTGVDGKGGLCGKPNNDCNKPKKDQTNCYTWGLANTIVGTQVGCFLLPRVLCRQQGLRMLPQKPRTRRLGFAAQRPGALCARAGVTRCMRQRRSGLASPAWKGAVHSRLSVGLTSRW